MFDICVMFNWRKICEKIKFNLNKNVEQNFIISFASLKLNSRKKLYNFSLAAEKLDLGRSMYDITSE